MSSITCKAAVAMGAKQKLEIVDIIVDAPKRGEVRVKVLSNALCHTDVYTLDGCDPEGLFPCILGHEAVAEVESIGEGVTSLVPGDLVIPCYTPQCKESSCIFCESSQTNLCPKIRGAQGKGLMSDMTSRFRVASTGQTIYHFMGCSTFSEYTVIHEISAAKMPKMKLDLDKICLLGCGVSTGWGAVANTCDVQPGKSVLVFGLGAVGLSVIQMSKLRGAGSIVGVDLNTEKFVMATKMGMTEGVDAKQQNLKEVLMSKHPWGYDYTFDCTGNTQVMRMALEVAHRGWGQSCVIGVAAAGHEIATRPFQLVTGRQWKGTAFGGWKSRDDVPRLVQQVCQGALPLDDYVTHKYSSLNEINILVDQLHKGECLRGVVQINQYPQQTHLSAEVQSRQAHFGGEMMRVSHYSKVNDCQMTFSVFLPSSAVHTAQKVPVLFFLAGINSTDENARTKSMLSLHAAQHQMALVFPDTSPRGVSAAIPQLDQLSWDAGYGAGFYVDATRSPYSKHFNMFSYIDKELPELVAQLFPIDINKKSISGFSMGGHGSMVCYLRNQSAYRSVSAFAPIVNPTQSGFGKKNYELYFNDAVKEGASYDSLCLLDSLSDEQRESLEMLVEQGSHDPYQKDELQFSKMEELVKSKGFPKVKMVLQNGYDHSYFFVASFAQKHIEYHSKRLV